MSFPVTARWTPIALVLSAALLAFAAGCRKKRAGPPVRRDATPPATVRATWVVEQVKVELIAQQGKELDIDATRLASRIGSGLRASEFFVADERDVPAGRTAFPALFVSRVSYGVIPDGSTDAPASIIAIESTVFPEGIDNLTLEDNVITERPLTSGEDEAALTAALTAQAEKAIDETVSGILAKEALRDADTATLKKALVGELDIVLWALRLIAHRRHRASLDDVIALFSSPDDKISGEAISTAVALGDPAAVEPMTRLADFQDHEQLRVIIEATSALGGGDAIEFLEFVVTGHDDETVREHASTALERLTRGNKAAR